MPGEAAVTPSITELPPRASYFRADLYVTYTWDDAYIISTCLGYGVRGARGGLAFDCCLL